MGGLSGMACADGRAAATCREARVDGCVRSGRLRTHHRYKRDRRLCAACGEVIWKLLTAVKRRCDLGKSVSENQNAQQERAVGIEFSVVHQSNLLDDCRAMGIHVWIDVPACRVSKVEVVSSGVCAYIRA